MKKLAIIGASGHGKVVADIAVSVGWSSIDFFDSTWPNNKKISRWTIVGSDIDFVNQASKYEGVFIAIGNNNTRLKFFNNLNNLPTPIVTLIHKSSVISSSVVFGCGVVIMPNAVINADSIIEDGVIINTSSTIDHDCLISSFSHISPGANVAGGAKIGERSWIGIGSSIKECVVLGNDVIVGAGAVVVNDIPSNQKVLGIPAKMR